MKKSIVTIITILSLAGLTAGTSAAHFQMIIPSDDIVSQTDSRMLGLRLMFIHPFEGTYMNMAAPKKFGVMAGSKKTDLLPTLQEKQVNGFTAYSSTYKIKRPGDHLFYVEPAPYWEAAEDCYIIHYTKVIVNSMGLEKGWDSDVGLKTEIVPLTRPYGLYSANIFQGIVKMNGKPVPFSEVEVEYFNEAGTLQAPAAPFITQVVKADQNGVFTYAMPRAGWWGFAALNTDTHTLKGPDGRPKPVELGAVLWVKTYDME
ncbi:MAG: DUF4198 domain-containing protein [Deltaproteobacteria bacterium]|nr:DUF4198 domain-containing protein [Deltaproteobacteria bacterium]